MSPLRLLTLVANGPNGELHDPLDGNTFLADVVDLFTKVARANTKVALGRISSLETARRVIEANPAERLQLVGHGGRGELELGCSWDTRCFLPEVRSHFELQTWLTALPPGLTELYLIGCEVGSGDQPGEGHELLRTLASATSAAVFGATGPALACLFDDLTGDYLGSMARYDPSAGALTQVPARRLCPSPVSPWTPPGEPPRLRFMKLLFVRRSREGSLEQALHRDQAAALADACRLVRPTPDGGCVVERAYRVEVTVRELQYAARFELLSGDRGRLRPADDEPLPPELLAMRWDVRPVHGLVA